MQQQQQLYLQNSSERDSSDSEAKKETKSLRMRPCATRPAIIRYGICALKIYKYISMHASKQANKQTNKPVL